MQWTSITVIHILTMFVFYMISDHTDSTVIQHAASNVDAFTHCAYLFLTMLLMCSSHFKLLCNVTPRILTDLTTSIVCH